MRAILIFNPWANRGQAIHYRKRIEAICRQYNALELAITTQPEEAIHLAAEASRSGYELVVAAGGDGTVHEVVNGLLLAQNQTHARLGILPIGSGNDLAFSLGIPMKLDQAVQRLYHGQPRLLDLAQIEDEFGRKRVAGNNLGIGFDAQVVIQTEQFRHVRGFLLYLLATLKTLIFHHEMHQLRIRFDDEKVEDLLFFLALGLGRRGGGGFHLTPDASHTDNLIDSCMVAPIGRLQSLFLIPKAMKGTHVTTSYVTMRQNRRIEIVAQRPMPIHIDGEVFAYPHDNVRQVTILSLPAAIQVMT